MQSAKGYSVGSYQILQVVLQRLNKHGNYYT